jgi:small-conductance mechanosensitive channel
MKTFLFADSIINSLTAIAEQFLAGIPNLLKAIVIFIVGWIIARIVRKMLQKALEKIQIDKLGEKLNEIEIVSKANLEVKLSDIFAKVIYYFLMLFVLVAASDALGMPAVSQLVADIFNFIPNLIVALLVLILGLLLAEAIKKLVVTALTSLSIPSAKMIGNVIFYFLFINILVSALTQAKINTAFLSQNLTMLIGGVVLAFGLGYGIASKDIIANFLTSFYFKDRVRIGEKITIDGVTGEVVEVSKSSFTLVNEEGQIIIPMSKLNNNNLTIHN